MGKTNQMNISATQVRQHYCKKGKNIVISKISENLMWQFLSYVCLNATWTMEVSVDLLRRDKISCCPTFKWRTKDNRWLLREREATSPIMELLLVYLIQNNNPCNHVHVNRKMIIGCYILIFVHYVNIQAHTDTYTQRYINFLHVVL